MPKWDSAQYLKFEAERTQPSKDLANRLTIEAPKKILDIGCGPGNSTAVLARRYPGAHILGIDNSEEMIAQAQRDYPSLQFRLFDASGDLSPLGDDWDVVFSNACIQWLPKHTKLIPHMMALLRRGGQLAVQTPIQQSLPIHAIILQVAALPQWAAYFKDARHFHNLTPEEYFDILYDLSVDTQLWRTTYYHVMNHHSDILEWYRGTGLRPYLQALPTEERPLFEMEVLQRVVQAYPLRAGGKVLFEFPRLFFTAIAL